MPTFQITAPDGRRFRVTAPEGATQEQALAKVQEQYARQQAGEADMKRMAEPTGGFLENAAAGAGKAFYDVARGAGQIARSALPESVSDAAGLPTQADIDQAKKLDAPLMKTGGGVTGNVVGGAALFAPTALIPGANTVTGAAVGGAVMGALQPVATGESRLTNTALGGATGGLAQKVASKLAPALRDRADDIAARASQEQAQNAVRDTVLSQSKKAGYVVPPAQTNPGIGTQLAESVAGKISTEQAASRANQKVTDTLAREGLGLPKMALLTEQSLANLRSQAGKAYEAIKKVDVAPIGGKMDADAIFQREVADIGADIAAAAREFPESTSNVAIERLTKDLGRGSWSPTAIIEKVKSLRSDATANFKAFSDPERLALARAQRQAAEALDGLMERRLTDLGKAELAKAYTNARQLIAKAHDVEAALTPSGHVDARVIARIADRATGPLKTIADFGGNFPKAANIPEKVGSAEIGTLRAALGAGAGTLMGGPAGGAIGGAVGVAVPWAVRKLLLSRAGQRMGSPSYANPVATRAAATALENPVVRALLPPAAAGGALYLE